MVQGRRHSSAQTPRHQPSWLIIRELPSTGREAAHPLSLALDQIKSYGWSKWNAAHKVPGIHWQGHPFP